MTQRLCSTVWQHIVRRSSVQRPAITNTQSPFLRPGKEDEICRQDRDLLERILNIDVSSPPVHGKLHVLSRLQDQLPLVSRATPGLVSSVVKHSKGYNNNKNDRFRSTFCEEIWLPLIGSIAIYSQILHHKRTHREKEKCPLYILKKNLLFHAVDPKNTSVPAISNKDVSDDTSEISVQKLDEAFEKFQQESDECVGDLLNKCALEYRKRNKYRKAFELFQSASNYGHVPAIYNVGLCYEFGHGVEMSFEKAAKYYREAADKGHVKSMFNIATFHYEGNGRISGESKDIGFYYMKKAADNNLVRACSFVALKYAEDGNWNEAFKYFKTAAEQHDKSSLFNLAVCLQNGLGTTKDLIEAVKYYHKGAEMGDSLSQYHLGDSYEHGHGGVKKDLKEALKWFKLAMENGQPESKSRVELLEGLVATEDPKHKHLDGKNIFSFLDFTKSLVETRYKFKTLK